MSIKPSVVYIKGVHSITGHDTDSDIGFPQLELEKLFEGAIIKETTDTAYDSNKKYIHYDSLNNQAAIQDTGHFNCIKNGYYSIANGINHYYTKSGDNYNYNAVPSNVNTWAGKWSFSNTIKNKDLYSISSESDRICISGNYYKKSGNDYVKQDVITYNTYDDSVYVNWNNKYIGETTLDENFNETTVWKTNNGTIATSGYYLSIDHKPNGTHIVQLLNLTFDAKGVYSGDIIFDSIYKLPSDFNFQDSVTYYLKNGDNFEGLKVNQGQCTFTTDPATDNNFYIYQKGADWSYPNTTGPEYSILALNNVYVGVYSDSYYEKNNNNNYVKQTVKSYDLYKEGQQVLWDDNHKYNASVIDVDENFNNIYGWTLSNGTLATSGWYLSINETSNTFIVKLLNCTFNNGVLQNNFTNLGTLYKLDTDSSFGSITWYIRNDNKLEKITANTDIVFNTNPTENSSFYLYQKLKSYTYPNTVAPETASLYTESNSLIYESFNKNNFPVYEIATATEISKTPHDSYTIYEKTAVKISYNYSSDASSLKFIFTDKDIDGVLEACNLPDSVKKYVHLTNLKYNKN